MSSTKNPGRLAGLLYVLTSIVGFFAMGYVPGKLIVYTNATTTAGNIVTHQTLFRLGIAGSLIGRPPSSSLPWRCTTCSKGSIAGTPRSW